MRRTPLAMFLSMPALGAAAACMPQATPPFALERACDRQVFERLPGTGLAAVFEMQSVPSRMQAEVDTLAALGPARWGTTRVDLPHDVLPGERVRFRFEVRPGAEAGSFPFRWALREGGLRSVQALNPDTEVAVRHLTTGPRAGAAAACSPWFLRRRSILTRV